MANIFGTKTSDSLAVVAGLVNATQFLEKLAFTEVSLLRIDVYVTLELHFSGAI